jgi:hypothetical protein
MLDSNTLLNLLIKKPFVDDSGAPQWDEIGKFYNQSVMGSGIRENWDRVMVNFNKITESRMISKKVEPKEIKKRGRKCHK